jgi:hypothetical protein
MQKELLTIKVMDCDLVNSLIALVLSSQKRENLAKKIS